MRTCALERRLHSGRGNGGVGVVVVVVVTTIGSDDRAAATPAVVGRSIVGRAAIGQARVHRAGGGDRLPHVVAAAVVMRRRRRRRRHGAGLRVGERVRNVRIDQMRVLAVRRWRQRRRRGVRVAVVTAARARGRMVTITGCCGWLRFAGTAGAVIGERRGRCGDGGGGGRRLMLIVGSGRKRRHRLRCGQRQCRRGRRRR